MIYIKYTFLVPISLILTLISLPLSIIFPLFAIQKDGWLDNHSIWGIGPRLPTWLNWFMTPDNSLDGDGTFQQINGKSYLAKVKWLLRNPAYSFALQYLNNPDKTQVFGDKTIKDNDNAKSGWLFVHANGLFQFTTVIPIGFSRCIYCNFGWNIRGLVDVNVNPKPQEWQATFVFSPRLSGFR